PTNPEDHAGSCSRTEHDLISKDSLCGIVMDRRAREPSRHSRKRRRLLVFLCSVLLLGVLSRAGAAETLIPLGAVWRYLDTGIDQGTAWRQTNFNDSTWATGPSQLGFGDG